ncbi:MAG: hypothetical protein WBV55_24795 [Candidatus Sulfotelmatobacter sp.]
MQRERVLRVALFLILADLLLGGVADALNRTLVEMPAWHHLGAGAWAAFSRMADLGNGEILYPLVGIGGTASVLAAAIIFRFSSKRPWSVALPLYGTALMAVCGLLTTTQAAPIMLSLHRVGDDPAALRQAFEGFYKWDSIRAVFGAIGYCAEIWALVALLSVPVGNQVPDARQNILSSEQS